MGFSRGVQDLLDRMERKKPSAIMALCGETPMHQKILGPGHYKCTCPFPGHTDRAIGSFDLEQSAKRYSVSGAGKPTLTIRRSNQVKSLWNRGNQLILDANTPFTQDGFHLCPHLLNGIQIRAIWRQIERYCTFCSNQFAHRIAMMRSEIVHNDIVTLMNRR